MKRFFFLLAVLFSFSALAQGELKVITTPIFTVEYSEDYEQPVKLSYVVDCWDGRFSRSGLNFYKVDGIHTSDNADYYNNVWDKGHLAPAASFSCDAEELRMTFSYLNCALQHEDLNRGPWKYLEEEERKLAAIYGQVEVTIFIHFDDSERLETGAMVPCGFTKEIKLIDNGRLIKSRYYFPNNGFVSRKDSFLDFQIK